jgi:glycerol-3-phosphate cytidylyltransferase-like family protein
LDAGLSIVAQLKPVSFEWKDEAINRGKNTASVSKRLKSLLEARRPLDAAMQGKQMGFIAQDVEKILPSVVVTEPDFEKTKGMKYSDLIPVLVKAIQEQQAQLTKDEATIAAMKAKLGM